MFMSPYKEETTLVLRWVFCSRLLHFQWATPQFFFSFLIAKIDNLKNWKQIMKIDPESFMLRYEFSTCVNLSALPLCRAGREDRSLKEDNLPSTEWTKIPLATCWHLLKELHMFSTTMFTIPYICRTWSTNQVSGSHCGVVPLAELGCRCHLLISLPSAALPAVSVGDLLGFREVTVKMKHRL